MWSILVYIRSVKTTKVSSCRVRTYLDLVGILMADDSLPPHTAKSNVFDIRRSEDFGRGRCCIRSMLKELDYIVLPIVIKMVTQEPHLPLTDILPLLGDRDTF